MHLIKDRIRYLLQIKKKINTLRLTDPYKIIKVVTYNNNHFSDLWDILFMLY